jgi:O-antigen ligase
MEIVVLAHLGAMIVGTSWAFGGQAPWIRQALVVWGSLGLGLFAVLWIRRELNRPAERLTPLRDLWPLLLFDVLVGLSSFNPSFQTMVRAGEAYFVLSDPPWAWLPSTARPDLSLLALWLFNGIVVSCYNASLVLQRRQTLRWLLAAVVTNGVLLAIFGTFQKLVHADGLWFGLVPSPQSYFFSTFVYHNHWGAFSLLNIAAGLGLLFHFARHGKHRDAWHSPILTLAVAVLVLAAAVPLSGSRSSSALAGLFLFGALGHFLVHLIRRRRRLGESPVLPVLGLAVASVAALGAVLYLGRDVIRQRAELTVEQVARIRTEDRLDTRLELYRDTWHMARDKPWFGWGLDTYGDVFRIYNTFPTPVVGGFKPYYREAHNDWLQSLAETGFVGTLLLALAGLVPLLRAPWRQSRAALPRYLLAGCGLILLYATFEFPFANPSVMIGFWCCLFCARRYAVLDARPG